MAQGRLITIAIADDPEFNTLSTEAALLYTMALPHLDRDGLIDGNPVTLWATAARRRVDLLDRAPVLINEWVERNLVLRYQWKDGPILFFKGFRKHNLNIPYKQERASRFPPPPGWIRTRNGMIPEDEERCLRLAVDLHPSSTYRKELLSRVSRDLLATMSPPSREEDQQQDQQQDQSVVVVSPYTPVRGTGGDPGGGDPAAVRDWAIRCMSKLQWKDRANFHDEIDDEARTCLYAWLSYWESHTRGGQRTLTGINNPAGYIRWQIAGGDKGDGPVWPEADAVTDELDNLINS